MPTYSQGPRLLKGAIVAVDPVTSEQTTIAFRCNPDTLTRTLTAQQAVKVRPLHIKPSQTYIERFGKTRRGDSL